MIFRDSTKFKHGALVRGDKCLWRSLDAVYLGSYRVNMKSDWVHLFYIESNDCVITDITFGYVTTSKKKHPELEGQMSLV